VPRSLNIFALALVLLLASGLCGIAAHAQEATPDLVQLIAQAAPGAVISVPPGTYPAPLLIDKSVTLEGNGAALLQGDGSGNVVHITAPGVTLRGFDIRGTGLSLDQEHAAVRVSAEDVTVEDNQISDSLFGIYLENAPRGVLRGNTITGMDLPESRRGDGIKLFYSPDTLVEGNTLQETRDTIIWYSPGTTVRGNFMNHGRYGLHFMSTDNHVIEENVLRGNSVGIYLMYGSNYTVRNNLLADNRGPSGYGLGLKETNRATIEGNRFVNNRVGVYSDSSPLRPDAVVTFRSNLFAFNENGLVLLPNVRHNVYTENIFLENAVQLSIAGGGELTQNEWSLDGRGNYWSDYHGFDGDGDAIGDMPYLSQSLYEDIAARHPELRLFQLSPAADAVDLAAKAFPIFAPRPLLEDPHPLTRPPALPPVPGMALQPVALNLAVAILLLAAAAIVLTLGLRSFLPRKAPPPLLQSSIHR
jgi:nitrous oxidase accessory protein